MKKVLLLLIIFTLSCTFGWAQLGVGQQFQNNNFESWRNETNSRRAPEHWNSLNSGTGSLQSLAANDFVSEATSYNNSSCVQLTCRSMLGVKANGGLTCGRFNAGSMSAGNTANCTYTHSSNDNFRQTMTAYPDSVYIWTKTSISNDGHEARINIVIHNNVPASNNAIYQDPTPSSANASVVNTTGAVNEAKVVAKATKNFRAQGNWVQQKIDFDYNSYESNNTTPSYILATFSTNKTAGTGTNGDNVWLDDIVLIYNTRLATLTVGGNSLDGFNPDVTTYPYPTAIATCAGATFPNVSGTCQSAHAHIEIKHNPSEEEPYTIIRVQHNNQEDIVFKDYTINFNVIKTPAAPTVSAPDADCAASAHPVQLTASSEGASTYHWYTSATGSEYNTGSTGPNFTTPAISGSVTYYVSALNAYNCESSRTPITATVNINPAAPTAASTTTVCAGENATFSATLPAGNNLTCRWYATNSSTEVLGTGTSLEVSNLTQSTTRYAETYNTVTGCKSGRTAVTVNVNSLPAAPTNLAGGSLCGAGTVTLSATPAAGTICQWFANTTGGSVLSSENSYTTPSINTTTNYYVASYNSNTGCSSARQLVTATINQIPSVSISAVNPICAGESVTLTANGATSYSWNNNLGEGNNKQVSPNANTTYTVIGTDANGCTNTASVTVTVKQLPNVSINAVDPLCAGESATLIANGATSYSWDNNLGDGNNKQVTPGITTTYNVTGTNNGCSNTASVTVTVNQLPNVSIDAVNPLCAGESATLIADGATSYNWDHNLGEGNNKQVTPGTTTTYTVIGTNANGCSNTASVTVTVNTIPTAPTAEDVILCGSSAAVLIAVPAEGCTCQWFNANDMLIETGVSIDSKTLTTSILSSNTVYHVRSVNPNTNCHSSNTTITVTVAAMPGRPTASGKSRCGAGSVVLTATPGNNADNCHWYNTNNEFLYEGTTYQTDNLEGNTNFICKSYNSENGCESSSTQQVTVTINPIPGEPTVSGNNPICGSGAIQLTGTAGANATTCRWINGEDTSTTNNFNTGIISQSTDYLVQSYNPTTQCSSENVTVSVVVNSLPATPQATNDTQCSGSNITLTASSAEHTVVRWYASAQDNNILYEGSEFHPTNLTIGEHNFYAAAYNTQTQCSSAERAIATATLIATPAIPNVADINHCGPATFTLNVIDAQDGITYKWYENAQGGTAFHTGSSYTTGELSSSIHYYVSATTNGSDCESDRKDVTITINPIPANLTINGNNAICAGQSLTVSATADNATNFVWSDGQSSSEGTSFTTPVLSTSTNYTIKAYNANTQCESAVMEFTVTVHPNPEAPEASPVTLCQNETAVLSAVAESGNTCYWYASEESENAISTGNNYSPTDLTVGNTTFYVSQRNNQTHCESSRTAVVATVYPTYAENYPVTACDSFRWNNELFTESGNYERNLYTQHNCDSVVTLQLTINHSKVTTIDTTVCDVFVWNNQSYETSGNYQQSFTTVQHCDSTVYVHLTVKKSTTGSDHIYLCNNQLPYNYNNIYTVTTAGTFTVHTENAAGCDSSITLTVSVNNQPSAAINLTPADRCGAGTVTLTAHAGQNGTTCRWYASEESTEVLATNTQYTTGNLNATTTYYVSSYNDYNGHPCESGRQAIIATINPNPAEPTVADQVRCGDGSVEFTATIDENATTCRWYVTASTSNISATALSYTTNINVSNGSRSFYVESYNSITGCKSDGRKEVKAEAFAIPTAPVLTAMSNCGPQEFSINAPTNGYYKWYDNAESTSALDITNNTTPSISESRSYFISHAMDYTGISCESGRSELALTIYPVYQPQNLYDTLCQGETYTQHGLSETFNQAGPFDRVLNTVSSHACDSLVTLHLWVKEIRSYSFDTTVCDSYVWNGETFTESEIITHSFTSSIGCDSVVTVNLTVNKSTEKEFSETTCDSYQWNNETYTTSGDYVQHFNTVNGCDSMVTLHLTVNASAQEEFSEIACNEYIWNNETYTTSGDYEQHFLTSKGCDSTVTLHLTVNYSNAATLSDNVCAGTRYQANGFDTLFNVAGNYTLVRHDLNQAGCDSTTTLTLTVNPIYNRDVTLTICETALPYTWNDITYPAATASGDYEHTFSSHTAAGCDSIVTLHLTISHQYVTPLTADICEGQTYSLGNRILDQSGIYYDTLQASNLCDSIIKLTLTVHELDTTNLSASICLGETYAEYGFNVTPEEAGIFSYQQKVQTSFGCDSTINLTLTVNPVYFTEQNASTCDYDEYTWEGHNVQIGLLAAGTYTIWDSLKTVNNCDSIFKLNLTVYPSFYAAETATTCDKEAYVWEGHNVEIGTLTAGTHIFWDSLKTVNLCDSVYMLTLTVYPTFYEEEEDITCSNEAYVWEGHNVQIGLLEAGEHIIWDSLKTVNSCDSVYKLTLTVNAAFYDEAEAVVCNNETYVWEGHNVEIGTLTTGTYIFWDSLKTVNLCDSVYKLTLTVTPTFYKEEDATICDNQTYVWEGHNVEIGTLTAGTHIFWDSLKTVNLCDSVYKLTLTVNQTKHTDLHAEICEGDVYEYNDNYYDIPGEYNFTFQSVQECDSFVTLHLTVNPVYSIDTNVTICQGMLPYNFADTMFYGSGNKDVMLHTQHGCDSIFHVHLSVTPYTTASQTITICDNELPYQFLDSTFYTAGIYEVTETFADGCDKITTVTLIVNPTYDTTVYVIACGSYTLDRGTYQRVLTESDIYVDTLSTLSGCDSIVRLNLTINPLKDTVLTPAICMGDSYAENGFNLTPENTGIVYDTLHLQCVGTGCDSTVYLELTVNPSYEHTFNVLVCDSFVWNNQTYTMSGNISHTYTLATGCDSTVHINLTVNPSYNLTFDTTVCDLFVWDNQTYVASEIISRTYNLASGCDSTVTYNLTVNHSKDSLITETICMGGTYELNGFDIQTTEAGIIYDTLYLQCVGTGCDSTVYLELTVNPTYEHTFNAVVCDSFVWNNQTYTESDIISHTYTLATGCDSTVHINLTVNPSYNLTIDTTVCDQFVWNGQNYTESGTLTHTYTLSTGCDSTVTINLTVNHSVTENQTFTICQSELPYIWRDITFDTATLVGTHNFTYERETAQHCDSIVNLTLIVNPNNEYYENPVSFCEGGSFEWNNQIITESGLYTDTVDNDYGCYDVYKLEVTVHPVYSFTEYDTVCDNELPVVWQGRTINQAGTTTVNYHTTNGCDSTFQLVLTVNPSYFIPETVNICDIEEYVWEGHNVAIGQHGVGTYTFYDSLTTAAGCDSVYQLTLNVTPTYYLDVETATVCDHEEYVWEGHEVQIGQLPAGFYIFHDSLTTVTYGCDSIHTLALTVTPSYHFDVETDTICDNEEYVWAGHEHITIGQLTAGTHTFHDSLTTVSFGCDSIYTLILTVNPNRYNVETASACSNETVYNWHGRDITATGIYYDTLTTSLGCDSVCELRFTLLEPTAAIFADTTCTNALYQGYGFEVTPTLSGDTTLVRVTENVAGCDSTITVNLYVKPLATFTFDTIVCGAFQWNNQWYTESGSYQQSFPAANGCDSIVTMNLIIDTPSRDTIEVVACESYEWDGTIYTQSGVFSKIYPQTVGCDSIAVMILTINHVTEVTLYDTTCQAHRYQEYGFDTLTMNVGTFTLQRIDENQAGCDSIINLILTVHRSYLYVDSASTCDNEDFVWHGIHCDTTGIYYKNYETMYGCDSVYILFLTVYPSYEVDVTDTAIAGTLYHNHGLNFTPQNPGVLNIDVPRTAMNGCDSTVHITLVVIDGSGIDMHYLDKHITLFPNPTDNVFTVSSTLDIIRELTIYDNNGRAVLRQSINDYSGQVNVENLTPGIYFVRMMTPDNIVTKKLIVR
ncbi:MAG: T9SS type A sorting domain-containing protein [Bacteroidales bacterium]|nr:T9SS type A sorting domain-containing protein [Bacteroidales bacterium]